MGEFSRELLGGRQLLGKAHRRFRLVDCLDLAPHPAILMESSDSSPRSLDSMNSWVLSTMVACRLDISLSSRSASARVTSPRAKIQATSTIAARSID